MKKNHNNCLSKYLHELLDITNRDLFKLLINSYGEKTLSKIPWMISEDLNFLPSFIVEDFLQLSDDEEHNLT